MTRGCARPVLAEHVHERRRRAASSGSTRLRHGRWRRWRRRSAPAQRSSGFALTRWAGPQPKRTPDRRPVRAFQRGLGCRHVHHGIARAASQVSRLVWRGDIERARAVLTRFLSFADERGEAAVVRLDASEHVRARDCGPANGTRYRDFSTSGPSPRTAQLLITPTYRAVPRPAGRGPRVFQTKRSAWAAQALARGSGTRLSVGGARGAARARDCRACSRTSPARAVESLREVWEHTAREGVEEPGAFPGRARARRGVRRGR